MADRVNAALKRKRGFHARIFMNLSRSVVFRQILRVSKGIAYPVLGECDRGVQGSRHTLSWLGSITKAGQTRGLAGLSGMADQVKLRYADVGINLSDSVFRGVYHGKQSHEDDLNEVVQRALDVGCTKLMVTGSNLKESQNAVDLAQRFPGVCYATVGVHPCSTQDFDKHGGGAQKLLEELKNLALHAKVNGQAVAFGEIGLDYDRLFLSPKDVQLKYFQAQLDLAAEIELPLFLHSRACSEDFERILLPRLNKFPKRGLVHSFTGTLEEMQSLLKMGFDIGINGCSLKTAENLAVVKEVPLDRMQIETDGPWCEIRASHASARHLNGVTPVPKAVKKEKWQKGLMVKGRNEPATIVQVAHVIAKVKGLAVEEVCDAVWKNSTNMFGLGVKDEHT